MPKLKTSEIIALIPALAALDHYNLVDAAGAQVTVPYAFSAKTRFNIAKNLRVASQVDAQLTKAKNALVRKYADETGKVEKDNPNHATIIAELNALADATNDAVLLTLPYADLVRDDQPVPASVIATLMPIIDDTEAPAPPAAP